MVKKDIPEVLRKQLSKAGKKGWRTRVEKAKKPKEIKVEKVN